LVFNIGRLAAQIAWGTAKIIAMLLTTFAIPFLAYSLLVASGVILLLPIAMLFIAVVLLNN